ncbi:vasorin a [Trichomycterus rosablanca]|uniref:vasorin a n=1 Tax=Trichomycterus rosablanca TaxID=2290929 RepID=UPI002F350D3E
MSLWTFSWKLALLSLLLLPEIFCRVCPQHCSCSITNSIFCTQRRATSMPLNLPVSTRQLYVFQNGITSLQQHDILGLVDLVDLDLSQNELKMVPDGVFSSLSSLQNLDLSSNHITHISKDSFAGLLNLERLYLHNNRIQRIHPEAFTGLEQLLELKLHGNQIDVLPALKLPRLLLLDISNNRMALPGPKDLQTSHLESLKVAGLGLTTLDEGLIRSLGNLHDLDVSQNKLTELPPVLRSAKGLIGLNLAGNPLGPLSQEDFKNLVGLQKLDLSSLNLQGFPVGFLQMFPRLNQLTAAENPFNCVCPLASFLNWLKDMNVELGRKEETRCHFPPVNAGKILAELEHKDFGCPTTITELSDVFTTIRMEMTPEPTTAVGTTLSTPVFLSTKEPLVDFNQYVPQEKDAAASSSTVEHEEHMCPVSICLNGGTCRFDQGGQIDCLCPPETSGKYCENQEEPQPSPVAPRKAVMTVPVVQPDSISSHHVTSTSISLDLHRYIESRPNIRGIRLTYRNLSGPDRRPLQLNVPPSYPEYTLRGLQPNCTYFVCASPLGEPVEEEMGSCMEARTSGVFYPPPENKPEPFFLLVPILVAVAAVMAVMIVTLVVVVLCKRITKTPKHLDLADPTPFELEGVKTCLENGTASQKRPERLPLPQNHTDYETLLIQEQFTSNNNTNERLPSYF